MLERVLEKQFEKDYKKATKRGKNIGKLIDIISLLVEQKPLPENCRNHKLQGDFKGHRECHIEPNWLLIYLKTPTELILVRMGSQQT